MNTYVIFLRGININGHKKVPMADLRTALEKAGFSNVKTMLASGNVLVDSDLNITKVQSTVFQLVINTFGFEAAIMVRTLADLTALIAMNPFSHIAVDKNIKPQVTFVTGKIDNSAKVVEPLKTDDFEVVATTDSEILSIVYLDSKTGTPGLMKALGKQYGKNITTRTWNTLKKLALLSPSS